MASQNHLEATARAVAVLRAVRERHPGPEASTDLDSAIGICCDYLLEPGHPTPEIPETVELDAAAVRSAVVSMDRVQDDVPAASRSMLDDAQAVLDDVQAELEGDDG